MLYILRHGDSLRQKTRKTSCWPEKFYCPLTPKGKNQIKKVAENLKSKNIDLIFSSDLLRTKQTAEIVANVTRAKIIYDKRLREFNVGKFNNKSSLLAWNYLRQYKNPYLVKLPEGESLSNLQKRIISFLRSIKYKAKNKNILVISHELPLTILELSLKGKTISQIIKWRTKHRDQLIKTGELREINL